MQFFFKDDPQFVYLIYICLRKQNSNRALGYTNTGWSTLDSTQSFNSGSFVLVFRSFAQHKSDLSRVRQRSGGAERPVCWVIWSSRASVQETDSLLRQQNTADKICPDIPAMQWRQKERWRRVGRDSFKRKAASCHFFFQSLILQNNGASAMTIWLRGDSRTGSFF